VNKEACGAAVIVTKNLKGKHVGFKHTVDDFLTPNLETFFEAGTVRIVETNNM
jgi:hypothetical protein